MAEIKGLSIATMVDYVREVHGERGLERWRAALTEADRDVLDGLVPVGWYPLDAYTHMLRALRETVGGGENAVLLELGRYSAERSLRTIHRLVLRLANPAFVVEKAADLWRRYYDTGRLVTERLDRGVKVRVVGLGVVDEALCLEQAAYMARTLELGGGVQVDYTHPACRLHGHPDCLFEFHW